MRKKIIAGNWKMNKLEADIQTWIADFHQYFTGEPKGIRIAIFPPFTGLGSLRKGLPHYVEVGAQNVSEHLEGAYTGEISATMIADSGANAVLIGHSERRQYHHENNLLLHRKLSIAVQGGLTPYYCVGESQAERQAGDAEHVIRTQLREGMIGLSLSEAEQIVLAYEPVWAIGTGLTASKEDVQKMHHFIRQEVAGLFGINVAENMPILYGGSVTGATAPELLNCPDVDGVLVGGASLKLETFAPIINAGVEA
jgi:triosephosphate isomerase (TIM)